jgi:hypothetical protein
MEISRAQTTYECSWNNVDWQHEPNTFVEWWGRIVDNKLMPLWDCQKNLDLQIVQKIKTRKSQMMINEVKNSR